MQHTLTGHSDRVYASAFSVDDLKVVRVLFNYYYYYACYVCYYSRIVSLPALKAPHCFIVRG